MALKEANLVLWSARGCPWAQRVTLALHETGLEHSIKEIDLQAKPAFYNDKINPASKVPVLQIGGKDENDIDVPRIPESGVLLELVSDLAKLRGGRPLKSEDPLETGMSVQPASLQFLNKTWHIQPKLDTLWSATCSLSNQAWERRFTRTKQTRFPT